MNQLSRKSVALACFWVILGLVVSSACGQATFPNSTQAVGSSNVTITFANMQFDQGIDYQKLAAVFHQQNPTITVTVIPVDHSVQLADADIARQADVIFLPGTNPASLPSFLPLQPLLETAPDFNANDLWPGSLTSCSNDGGTVYGIPLTLYQLGVYYAPAIFDRDHIAYPQPGWTWSQLQQLVAQLGGVAQGAPVYGLVDGPYGSILEPLLAAQLPSGSSPVDAQAMAASLAWYVQLVKDQKLYPLQPVVNGPTLTDEMHTLLKNNQAAMWIYSPSFAGSNNQGVYLPYPVGNPTDHTTPVGANCGAVSAGTKNPQAAWAWLAFLSHQDLSGDRTSGLLPGRPSLVDASPYYASLTDPEKSALQYGLGHAWYYPWVGNTFSTIEQAVAIAIQNGTNLADALQGITVSTASVAQIQATSTPTVQTVNTPPTTPTSPENGVVITFTDPSFLPGAMDVDASLAALVTDFEKSHPEIKVLTKSDYPRPADGTDMHALAKNSDCFEYQAPKISSPWQQIMPGDVLDLTSLLDANPAMRDDFYPAFFEPFKMNGKVYGLPAGVMVEYMAYNADLLTRLGIPLPKAGWTLDDLLSIAGKAANLSANPPIYGFWDDNFNVLYAEHIPYLDTTVQPPQATFTSDAVTRAYAWFQQLFQYGTLNLINPNHDHVYDQAISQGNTALWSTTGLWNYNPDPNTAYSQPIYEKDFPFKVGYVPFPLLASGEPMSMLYNMDAYYISGFATQAKVQACWTWIQYLSGHPSIFGGYTPRQSVLPQESVGQNPEQFKAVQAAIEQYRTDGYENLTDPVLVGYNDEEVGALIGISLGKDVSATLAEAQRRADAYRACIAQKDLTGLNWTQVYYLANNCYLPLFNAPTLAPP